MSDNPDPAKPDPAKPEAPEPKAARSAHIVWCAPGYDAFSIGKVYKGPAAVADALQAAGKARLASKEEVRAAGDLVGVFG
jgi:hypothetical protein